MRALSITIYLVIAGVLASCSLFSEKTQAEVSQPHPTPTLHPFFLSPSSTPVSTPTEATIMTFASTHLPQPSNILTLTQVITTTIYNDVLDTNWLYLDDPDVTTNLVSPNPVHDGKFALSLTPKKDFQAMYFVIRDDTTEILPQDQVLSLNFWLNSGEDILNVNDLAVTIVGSNEYPYWVEGDNSVYVDGQFPFSETRLAFLGLNRAIPPNTWVEIEVDINSLIYDPTYQYITGFYIKNDQGFYHTFYVDNIRIIHLAPAGQKASASPTPTRPPLPTLPVRTITPTASSARNSLP